MEDVCFSTTPLLHFSASRTDGRMEDVRFSTTWIVSSAATRTSFAPQRQMTKSSELLGFCPVRQDTAKRTSWRMEDSAFTSLRRRSREHFHFSASPLLRVADGWTDADAKADGRRKARRRKFLEKKNSKSFL
jgi:hypothetical protein